MIGWQFAEAVVPPLLAAGEAGDHETGRVFIGRLLKLVTAPSIDLAVDHGGAGGPPLAEFVLPTGVSAETLDAAGIESAWAFGNRRRLVAHVETQAIANWRLWLATSPDAGEGMKAAFAAWSAG